MQYGDYEQKFKLIKTFVNRISVNPGSEIITLELFELPNDEKVIIGYGGGTRIRTGDKGFADLCLTTWLCRHNHATIINKTIPLHECLL